MKKIFRLFVLMCGWLPFVNGKAPAQGLIGSKLVSAEKTSEVFVFFNLARQGENEVPGGLRRITFKPTGEAFRALVTLEVTTDRKGVIRKLDLEVARSFIDDPRNGVFAADLVKTLLLDAGAPGSADGVTSLAEEIQERAMSRSTALIMTPAASPDLPSHPSLAYRIYAGNVQGQTLLRGDKLNVLLDNEAAKGRQNLYVIVSANG